MKFLLNMCSAAFALYVTFCIIGLLAFLDERRRGSSTNLMDHLPFSSYHRKMKENDLWFPTIIMLLLVIGALNSVSSELWSSTEIDAFFEKEDYQECYEATLYLYDKPIFCLVDMERITERYENKKVSTYYLETIYFPYNRSIDLYEEYDPKAKSNTCYLGEYGYDCRIILHSPATDASHEWLKQDILSNYGEFCGSTESDVFHLPSCKYVSSILPKNLIYFESFAEADILGFEFCDDCYQNY